MKQAGMWRWSKRIALGFGVLLIMVVAGGAISEQIARWHVMRDYPPQGKMVDIGGRRMQIDCRGHGSPTVIFESGAGPLGGLDWGKVQAPVAQFTRACSYSRAGELWSDPAGAPLTAARVAHDLHATLATAGEKPPYVMVGHSLGGPYVATYTGLYPDEVVGLVLIEPSFPDQIARLSAIIGPENAGFPQLRILRLGNTLAWTGLTRVLFSGKAADPKLPPNAGAAGLAWLFRTLPTLVEEYSNGPAIILESGQYRSFGNRPVIVLTGGSTFAGHATELGLTPAQEERVAKAWLDMNKEEASWSSRGQQRTIADSEHAIQLDQPQAVIDAIRNVLMNAKAN